MLPDINHHLIQMPTGKQPRNGSAVKTHVYVCHSVSPCHSKGMVGLLKPELDQAMDLPIGSPEETPL